VRAAPAATGGAATVYDEIRPAAEDEDGADMTGNSPAERGRGT
jgi:hypothetical protein